MQKITITAKCGIQIEIEITANNIKAYYLHPIAGQQNRGISLERYKNEATLVGGTFQNKVVGIRITDADATKIYELQEKEEALESAEKYYMVTISLSSRG